MKKAVVFGGSGFLGSHVADALTEKGMDVLIFDSKPSDYLSREQNMIVGSIMDSEAINEAVRVAAYVYNFAAIADIKEASEKPLETIKINIIGNTNILEACRHNNVERFVFASSVYVYSDLASFYRTSKQSCELIIDSYSSQFGLDYTILRYGSLYGPRANGSNFIHQVIEQALIAHKISRKGDGREVRDYIHVKDAARSSVEILDEEYKNQHVMITGTQTTRVRDLLEMIKEMLNNDIEINYLPERIEEHYEITPYSFRPRVAKKLVLNSYHDLGQGILDCIYDINSKLEGNCQSLQTIRSQLEEIVE
jgi:UDP-glucose 4-epimerase